MPDFIDPLAFAERQRQLTGKIALNEFTRLSDVLSNNNGCVKIDLFFSKSKRLATLNGTMHADLNVECQSCLEVLSLPLAVSINLAFVESLEHADKLAGEYEPFILEEKKISLNQLIEDELLLALPDFPRHSQPCLDETQMDEAESVEDNEKKQSDNPFSILAQLKNTGGP
ncbi:MAG: YceD family protein [Methylococcales bacterium]|nr:YceD family protein [Methylococcales bacterium]